MEGERGAFRLARPLESILVPTTVRAVLAARIDRLHPVEKQLLQTASVIGKNVPLSLLLEVADLAEPDVRQGLGALQTGEFLYETSLFPEIEHTFKHALTHDVAYGSLLQERRRALHSRIVEAIERLHHDRLGEHVEVLAHHAVRGGIADKAARYLRLAGEKSVARSAMQEAVEFLEAALRMLAGLPETTETLSDALDIYIALGPALISLQSAAVARVEEVYREALALVERLGDTSRRFPVVWGLWFISYTLGRYPEARDAGARLLEDAKAGDDTGLLVEAHHALWATLLAMGESAAAVPHVERGIALYQRKRHAAQAFLYAGHDPGVCCRYHLALTRWLLGYPDGAVAVLGDAQRLAGDLKHAQTTTITLWVAVAVQLLRGEHGEAAATAGRLVALADAHGFSHYLDIAVVAPDPTVLARLDRAVLTELHERLLSVRTAVWRRVFCLCQLVNLCLAAECPEEGRGALASLGEANRDAFLAPEIRRLEGELLLRDARARADEAERHFRTAVADARRRSEKSLELRATASLARLLDRQGRRDEARVALAPIYGWFTEGFDTADLTAARTLLDELSTASK